MQFLKILHDGFRICYVLSCYTKIAYQGFSICRGITSYIFREYEAGKGKPARGYYEIITCGAFGCRDGTPPINTAKNRF
jgi:hypothetical protein